MRLQALLVFIATSALLVACDPRPASPQSGSPRAPLPQVVVEDSGSKQVDDLVRQLVSPRPARFPNGFWGPETFGRDADSFIAPEVEHAIKALRDLGPSIFTNLVTHLRDDRYSYSVEVAAWLNQTVGDAIMDQIFADGYTMHSGYKGRETPSSANVTYLDFSDWVKEIGEEKWANWACSKTRLQIQMSFIDWCVEKEAKRGFVDDKQRIDLLNRYEQARQEMRSLYGDSSP